MGRIAVRVTPKAGRAGVSGVVDGEVHVRVTAAAEGGKANAAACKVLSEVLNVPKTSVRVVRGETSRHKQVEIDDLESDEIVRRVMERADSRGR